MTLLYAIDCDDVTDPGVFPDVTGNGYDIAVTGDIVRTAVGTGYTYEGAHPNARGMSMTGASVGSAGPALAGLQTAECTLTAWVKRSNNSQIGWFGEIKGAGSGDRGALLGLAGQVAFRCRNASGTAATPGVAQPAINTWYFFAGRYTLAAGPAGQVQLLINAVQVAQADLAGPLKTTSTSSHLFDTLGPETIIRDLRYFDVALSDAEIADLMDQWVTAETGVIGSGTAQLGALTAAATGVRTVSGAATASLGGLTAAATGVRRVIGAASSALGGIVATATGQRRVNGSGVAPLGGLAAAATGHRRVTGSGLAALGGLTAFVGHPPEFVESVLIASNSPSSVLLRSNSASSVLEAAHGV